MESTEPKKKKVYDLKISNSDNGIYGISLVEDPAIQSDFLLFSNEIKINFLNEDKKIITGPVLIPDLEIRRLDKETGEEFFVKISEEEIEKSLIKFFNDGNQKNSNIDHSKEEKLKDIVYFEGWLVVDPNNDKSNAIGLKKLKKGTLVMSMKVSNDELWDKIRSGELKLNGFSIEAKYELVEVELNKENLNTDNLLLKKENKKLIYKNTKNDMQNMDVKKLLSELKSILGVKLNEDKEVKFEDYKLEDGTLIRIDDTEFTVSVIHEDGSLEPAKDGEYTLEDGQKLYVKGGIAVSEEEFNLEVEVKQTETKKLISKPFVKEVKQEAVIEQSNVELEKVKEYEAKIVELEKVKTDLEKLVIELGNQDAKPRIAIDKDVKVEFEKLTELEKRQNKKIKAMMEIVEDIDKKNKEKNII